MNRDEEGIPTSAIDIEQAIADRFSHATLEDIRGRYTIGALAAAALAAGGSTWMNAIAARVGCSPKLLYQCAVVHKRMTAGELERCIAMRNVHGQPPTWSHLVALCAVPSRTRREALLTRWMATPTAVRKLAAAPRRERTTAGVEGRVGMEDGLEIDAAPPSSH